MEGLGTDRRANVGFCGVGCSMGIFAARIVPFRVWSGGARTGPDRQGMVLDGHFTDWLGSVGFGEVFYEHTL